MIVSMALAVTAYGERRHANIHKIGNRNVAGKIFGFLPNLVSLGREMEIGAQIAMQVEQTARMIEDSVVRKYVERVAQEIVKHSDAKVPFHIRIVDTHDVNAIAFPGGYLFLNMGLLLVAENEAEFAGVIAHEISHVCARHASRSISKAHYLEIATIPASFLGGTWVQMGIQAILGFGIDLEMLGISRQSEAEADQLGIQYMWNTGYDPNAFISFLEKLQALEAEKPGRFANWFRTHPCTENRIAASINEQRYLPDKDCYIIDTSEFQQVKSRLLASYSPAEGRDSGSDRPVLKRRKGTQEIDGNGGQETVIGPERGADDETDRQQETRPILKRAGNPPPNPARQPDLPEPDDKKPIN
jgi:predicted Zn-dependent protease